ncbi:pseudomurein-binding repeat-containing protein [Methanobrevibacter arboriphilus]|uniref:pseudomurein-binding repeat-containing protein n=1 Tax=Methanobrevibacter arboriphilus TaxID=39441 RepID=UPI000AC9232E|nr:pseudomurein-binding repeat-containing protein [Methanobrevibacter arboriphilus]
MQNNHQSSSLLANSNENLEDDIDLNSSTNSSNNSNSSNNNNINNSNNSSSNSLNVVKTSTNVNNKPTTLSQSSILLASNSIYKYINKYGKLPNYVTISGYKYSMSEFMYILSKTITYKYNKITSSIKVKYDVKNPSKASGNSIKGTISSKTYYSYAKNIVAFIEKK